MLPIIKENSQMKYDETNALRNHIKDYMAFKKTINHFIDSYFKLLNNSKSKQEFIKGNIPMVVRAIDKCIYKFQQKHIDCGLYFKNIKKLNDVMVSNDLSDNKKFMLVTKIMKAKQQC